jgi:chloramphenicol 3-O phosphotransferase
MPRIIILNGAGSAGKSSIAKALQTITTEPFLHVAMDDFLNMLPEAYHDHRDGLHFETVEENGKPAVVIKTGAVARRLFRGMRRAIAALAHEGNNLIVDDVMLENEWADYVTLLSGFDIKLVGVLAPLDVLETRERERGDRLIGLARWQFERVHRGKAYDLEIDTSAEMPLECAELIKEKFGL